VILDDVMLLSAIHGIPAPSRASAVLSHGGGSGAVFWLHIPKCGTSFKFSARLFPEDPAHAENACKKVCGGTHIYLPTEASTSTLSNVAVMLREPKQRVASAHAFAKTVSGHWCLPEGSGFGRRKPSGGHWGWPNSSACNKTMRHLDRGPGATFGEYTGCQTNMIMGYGCMSGRWSSRSKHSRSVRDVTAAAISRMHQFRFVGLESEWLLSICLFNFLQTGERYVLPGQLTNTRPTAKSVDKHDPGASFTVYNTSDIPPDPLDDELYRAAKIRFKRDLRRHGISESACVEVCTSRHCQKHPDREASMDSLRRRVREGALSSVLGGPTDGEDGWLTPQKAQELDIKLVP